MPLEEVLEELKRRNAAAEAGGGPERVAKRHDKGLLTARERIGELFDAGSFYLGNYRSFLRASPESPAIYRRIGNSAQ